MKKSKGFTLIELLIVIAIVSLLIAIITPVIAKLMNRQQAKTSQFEQSREEKLPDSKNRDIIRKI